MSYSEEYPWEFGIVKATLRAKAPGIKSLQLKLKWNKNLRMFNTCPIFLL